MPSKPYGVQVVLMEEMTREEFHDKSKATTETKLNQYVAWDKGSNVESAKAQNVGWPSIIESLKENKGGTPYEKKIGEVDAAKENSNLIMTYQKQKLL